MAEEDSKPKRNIATERKQKVIFKHPVFGEEYDFKGKYGLDITDERIFQLKKIFAIGNVDHSGIIGRRQFKDLMSLLGIEPTQEELDDMLNEMDENGDGQIEFEEFAVAMLKTYDAEMIQEAADTPIGAQGTRAWDRGEILWSCNSNIIVACCGVATAILVYFQFILVPLTLAYFMTFLLVPLLNVFEQRPLQMRGKSCCEPKRDEEGNVSTAAGLAVGKMPHGVAVVFTLAVFFGILIGLVALVASEMATFLDDPQIQDNMEQLEEDWDKWLNDSGVVLIPPPICEKEYYSTVKIGEQLYIDYGLDTEMKVPRELEEFYQNGAYQCPLGGKTALGDYDTMTDYNLCKGLKGVACRHDGLTAEDINGYISAFSGFFNMFAMVMLFVIYLMMEKNPDEKMFKGDNPALGEIEHMIDHYISLKTMLSFVTGLVVALILIILQIKLAVLFGIMSFVLNYIPNVGSVIAMFLPTPVVLLDPGLATWQKIGAFVGPGLVQGYVGNVLEPTVFGASLNMTPLSILAALVMWGSVWGLPGAVLSVPMLGIQKITMNYTNHPYAKYCLMLIREDPTLDEADAREQSLEGALSAGALIGGDVEDKAAAADADEVAKE